MKTSIRYNKSEIMRKAWQLKNMMGYDTFSQALKHSWQVAKNEAKEKEQDAKNEAIRQQWRDQSEAKKKEELEAGNMRIAASGMDLHTYTMTNYYANNRYNGD